MPPTLKVCEIFLTIQGESTRTGLPCVLVRLAGCNLRCSWCDTLYAMDGGEEMTVAQAIDRVAELRCRRVELTGGEPLIQPAAVDLLAELCNRGYEVLLETNGSLDISRVLRGVVRIMDVKCPSSGQADKTLWANVAHLASRDEVKFVLADRADYDFAAGVARKYALVEKCRVTFSPILGRLAPEMLAQWILADGLDVRLGLQLHKIIWPGKDRGV